MTVFGFADRRVAERLRQRAQLPESVGRSGLPEFPPSIQFKTPVGGIAAFTGKDAADPTTAPLPAAMCTAWWLFKNDSGDIIREQMLDEDGEPVEIEVANGLSDAIPGEVWIGAGLQAGGVYLADWMDCSDA